MEVGKFFSGVEHLSPQISTTISKVRDVENELDILELVYHNLQRYVVDQDGLSECLCEVPNIRSKLKDLTASSQPTLPANLLTLAIISAALLDSWDPAMNSEISLSEDGVKVDKSDLCFIFTPEYFEHYMPYRKTFEGVLWEDWKESLFSDLVNPISKVI